MLSAAASPIVKYTSVAILAISVTLLPHSFPQSQDSPDFHMSFSFPINTSAHGICRRCPWAVSEVALAALFHQHFLKCLCQLFPPCLSPLLSLSPAAESSKKSWELSLRAFRASSVFKCQQRVFTGLKYIVSLWLSANPQAKR